jgi:hypothetical protein
MGEHENIAACAGEVTRLLDGLEASLKGRKVRVLSNFNGQPWGRSKPSLKGKVFEVERVHYDGWPSCPVCTSGRTKLSFWPPRRRRMPRHEGQGGIS